MVHELHSVFRNQLEYASIIWLTRITEHKYIQIVLR